MVIFKNSKLEMLIKNRLQYDFILFALYTPGSESPLSGYVILLHIAKENVQI